MNRQAEQPTDPPQYPEQSPKQQLLCEAIEQDLQQLQRDIQVYVSRVIKSLEPSLVKLAIVIQLRQ